MKWLKRLDSKNAFYPSHNVIIILLHHSLKEKKKEIEKWSGQVSLVPYQTRTLLTHASAGDSERTSSWPNGVRRIFLWGGTHPG